MNSQRTPTPSESRSAVDVMLAEYKSLREEVGRFQDHQKEIMNFATVLILALATVTATLRENQPNLVRAILFFIPWAFFLLAAAYSERTAKLLLAADYIHNALRPEITRAIGADVWQWENFKRRALTYDRLIAWLLDKSRWLVFVVPVLFGAMFFTIKTWPPLGWNAPLITADLLALALAVYVMFIVDEASGIYSPCQLFYRPEPLKGLQRYAAIGIPVVFIAQFSVLAQFARGPLLFGSLGVCFIGLALAVTGLLYYSNCKVQADPEYVYRISLFGHVTRKVATSDPLVRFQPPQRRWRPLTLIIDSGPNSPQRARLSFRVWGGNIDEWKHDGWQPWQPSGRGTQPPPPSVLEDAFRQDLLGLTGGRRDRAAGRQAVNR